MSFASFGDLASSFQTRHLQTRMKQDLTQLGVELTTGLKSDMAQEVSGDFGPIAGIEHSLKLLTAYKQSIDEAKTLIGMSQTVLGNIEEQSQDLSNGLITAVGSNNNTMIQAVSADAREKFSSIVSSLNMEVAGRSIFAGAATNAPALADANTILSDIMTVISGETTASGVSNAIDNWFNAPSGGFETSGYLGSTTPMNAIRVGNGETASQPIKADDPEMRALLSSLVKSAVIAEGALSGDVDEQRALTIDSSNSLLNANDQMTYARARVGTVEARLESASAQNAAEEFTLEMSRNELMAADPFETATAMEALYEQVKTMYAVTSKISSLSFTDYMR